MKTKLFRTKAELITLFVIVTSISWVFTPIIEHIYETTHWEKISIEEFNKKLDDYREETKNRQKMEKEKKQKMEKEKKQKMEKENKQKDLE